MLRVDSLRQATGQGARKEGGVARGEEEVREEEAREDGGGRADSQAYAEVRVSVIAHHFVLEAGGFSILL